MIRRQSGTKAPLLLFGMLLMLGGCSDLSVPDAKSTFSRRPQLPEVPAREETVRGADDPAVVTLQVGNSLRNRRLSQGETLPSTIRIPTTNLSGVPVTAALQAVLTGTDIALVYRDAKVEESSVTLLNLSGPLPQVVDRICAAGRVFCSYRDGSLELQTQDTFIIELPPVEHSATGGNAKNTIAEAIASLSNSDAQIDEAGGNLIYTTNYEGQYRVAQYLDQLRNGRPLVVLQMYIWEVSLDSDNALGINWSDLKPSGVGGHFEALELASDTAISAITGGVSLGAILRGKVDASLVANFLSTQGVVQTVSSPQMTFVSGSSAEFKVGGTQRYISQVGQLVSSTVSGSSTSAQGVGTNTVTTDEVETGLKINVNGAYESGVIFATLDVKQSDLIRIQSVPSGTTTLQLPETTERSLSTVLRVRPGDNLVLAGMTSSRDTLDRDRLPVPFLGKLPLQSEDKIQNRELVILVKPSIVMFADKAQIAKAVPLETPASDIPVASSSGRSPTHEDPETAFSSPPETAVVDGNLIQSGFSSAFHTLPRPTPGARGGP